MNLLREIMLPRELWGFVWALSIQQGYLAMIFLLLNVINLNPFTGVVEWLLYMIHWKTLMFQYVLCLTTLLFGGLNSRLSSVEKHVCSTRLEKICRVLSPGYMKHFLGCAILGAVASYCYIGLFQSLDPDDKSLLSSFFSLESNFEYYFVVQHGVYIGIMFSLKYFICCLYIIKLTLNQESKSQQMKKQLVALVKDSIVCVLKSIHWYYIWFLLCGPLLENIFVFMGLKLTMSDNLINLLYSLANFKLFLLTFITGVMVFFNWSLLIVIYNIHKAERYKFLLEVPVKSSENNTLSVMLNSESHLLKYLAMMDLRLLSQHDANRRKLIFAISHPGGHAHQWKAISDLCISSLKQLLNKLHEYSIITAEKETKLSLSKKYRYPMLRENSFSEKNIEPLKTNANKMTTYLRSRPLVAYFIDELPGANVQMLFLHSQPLIWMIEALGYLVSASYSEDKFGVVQQTLPEIIRLMLDIKMAEEKLPMDLVGIRTYVKDPQGRYDHIHQRVALKNAVNASLCRIADTFQTDVNGIYLPEEYHRYLQRYLNRKNV